MWLSDAGDGVLIRERGRERESPERRKEEKGRIWAVDVGNGEVGVGYIIQEGERKWLPEGMGVRL